MDQKLLHVSGVCRIQVLSLADRILVWLVRVV